MAKRLFELVLLGAVTARGGPDTKLSRRTAALIGYLACQPHPVHRSELTGLLWPDRDEQAARANLRTVLHTASKVAPGLVRADRQEVSLAPDRAADVDVVQFDTAAGRGLSLARISGVEAHLFLVEAAAVYGGTLLPGLGADISDVFDEWLTLERARLEARSVQVLQALVDIELELGPYEATLQRVEQLALADEFGEGTQERLMRVLWARGDRVQALRRYDAWRRRVAAELGLQPTRALVDLAARIRTNGHEPHHHWAETRLPVRPLVIGREDELATVAKQLDGDARLVTLTGPAGVGKTTLAVELAYRMREASPRPVVHVDLTSVSDRVQLVEAVMAATGGAGPGTEVSEAALQARIDGRELLLILDNFEHLVADSDVVSHLHDACRGMTTLVVSRTSLRLRHEQVHELAPLRLPETRTTSRDDAMTSEAVRLFLASAARLGAAIDPTAENLAMVSTICERTDGLPLGIELAAARVPLLGLAGLRAALHGSHGRHARRVLADGPGDAPRGRSLSSAVRASLDLLTGAERELFARLAVFPAEFDLPAVEAVCDPHGDGADLLGPLSRLVEFHLVDPVPVREGEARFRLLETMRAVAAEMLADSGDADRLAEWHARHLLGWAENRVVESPTPPETEPGRACLPGILTALDWFHDSGHLSEEVTMLAALGPLWRASGVAPTGVRRLTRALAGSTGEPSVEWHECRIWRAGLVAESIGADAAAQVREALDRALPEVRRASRPGRRARCLAEAVHAAAVIGHHELARNLAAELEHAAATSMERWWRLAARWEMAVLDHLEGDDHSATARLIEVIAEARALHHRRIELYAWTWCDILGVDRRQLAEDPPSMDDLLTSAMGLGDRRAAVWLLVSMGTVAVLGGESTTAARHFDSAMGLARDAGYRHGTEYALMGLVGVCHLHGDLTEACRFHGVLAPRLDDLRRVMPRAYHDAYLAVAAELEGHIAAQPRCREQFHEGRRMPIEDAAPAGHAVLRELAGPPGGRVPEGGGADGPVGLHAAASRGR